MEAGRADMVAVDPGHIEEAPQTRSKEEVAGSGHVEDTAHTGLEDRGSDREEDMIQACMDKGVEPGAVPTLVDVADVLAPDATTGEDVGDALLTVALPARPRCSVEHPFDQGTSVEGGGVGHQRASRPGCVRSVVAHSRPWGWIDR